MLSYQCPNHPWVKNEFSPRSEYVELVKDVVQGIHTHFMECLVGEGSYTTMQLIDLTPISSCTLSHRQRVARFRSILEIRLHLNKVEGQFLANGTAWVLVALPIRDCQSCGITRGTEHDALIGHIELILAVEHVGGTTLGPTTADNLANTLLRNNGNILYMYIHVMFPLDRLSLRELTVVRHKHLERIRPPSHELLYLLGNTVWRSGISPGHEDCIPGAFCMISALQKTIP